MITARGEIKLLFLHFRAEGGHGDLHEVLRFLVVDLELICDLVEVLDGALGGQLKPVGDPDGVDALVDERLRLLHECAAEHDDSGGSIADLVVLGIRDKINDQKCCEDESMQKLFKQFYKIQH